MMGTPVCMAPEQARSPKDLTAAVDVYALGAVLMFAMTGRYPYERPTVAALLLAVTDPATDPTCPASRRRSGTWSPECSRTTPHPAARSRTSPRS